jgi:hypothetical protein
MIFKLLLKLFPNISCLSVPRSNLWRAARKAYLGSNPECAVCGRKKNLVPHHIIPVKIDPSKELDSDNLITLCEGPSFNCHLFFGHLRDWRKFNPDVRKDAAEWRKKISNVPNSDETL